MAIVWYLADPKVGTKTKFELGKDDKPVLTITTKYSDGSMNIVDRTLSDEEIKGIVEQLTNLLQ